MDLIVPESCRALIKLQRSRPGDYSEKINHDFNLIRDYIPDQAGPLFCLDIGCGLAGIDILINDFHEGIFHLVDYNRKDQRVYFGFNAQTAAYNSKARMDELIKINTDMTYKFFDADKDELSPKMQYDIVISLLSCGYHYPVETYLDYICNHLFPHGVFIADVRQGTNGINVLRKRFERVDVIAEENKAYKVACKGVK